MGFELQPVETGFIIIDSRHMPANRHPLRALEGFCSIERAITS